MSVGKELKERKLEHWCALIRNFEVVKALLFNQNHQEEEDQVWPEEPDWPASYNYILIICLFL